MTFNIKFKMIRERSILCFQKHPDIRIRVYDEDANSKLNPHLRITPYLFSFLQSQLMKTPAGQLYGGNLYVCGSNSDVF